MPITLQTPFPDVQETKIPKLLLVFIAEYIGTFILLFLGCMGECQQLSNTPVIAQLSALSFGFSVMISIQVASHISGSLINPQITLAAVILGKLDYVSALVYVLAQFLGSLSGYGLLLLLVPKDDIWNVCLTLPNSKITIGQAIGVEILITFVLVLFFAAVLDAKNLNKLDSLPLRFGIAVSCLMMVAGPYTGASMNSFRSFAPSLINNYWRDHWIYWVAPTVGSIVAAVFYRFVLEPPFGQKAPWLH